MPGISNVNPKAPDFWTGLSGRAQPDPAAIIKLLDDWMHEDQAEQRETFEFLRCALDEDRPAGYKLFP